MSRRGKKFCLDPGFYLDDCLGQIMALGAMQQKIPFTWGYTGY